MSYNLIRFDKYPRKVKVAESERGDYYEYTENFGIRSKYKKKTPKLTMLTKDGKEFFKKREYVYRIDLLPKYCVGLFINKVFHSEFDVDYKFNVDLYLDKILKSYTYEFIVCDKITKEIIYSNVNAGNPRFVVINGNSMLSGNVTTFLKDKIFNDLKEYYAPIIRNSVFWQKPIIKEKVRLRYYILDTANNILGKGSKDNWDIGNRSFPYIKPLVDLLVSGKIQDTQVIEPILTDDSIKYVTEDNGCTFFPILNDEHRQLVIAIITDDDNYYDNLKEIEQKLKHYATNAV